MITIVRRMLGILILHCFNFNCLLLTSLQALLSNISEIKMPIFNSVSISILMCPKKVCYYYMGFC